MNPDLNVNPRLNREHSQLPFLDGLRGWMAAWVIVSHCLGNTGGHVPILSAPMRAVEVFMILSGFLMAYYFRIRDDREPWDSPRTWLIFYIRRYFRIAPAYYLVLVPAFIFRTPLHRYVHDVVTTYYHHLTFVFPIFPPPFQFRDVIHHLLFTYGLSRKFQDTTTLPDWSISVEMQFYFFLPFIMLLYRRAGHVFSTVFVMAVWYAGNRFIAVGSPGGHGYLIGGYYMPTVLPLKINCFLVGILLAESFHFRHQARIRSLLLCAAALAVSCTASGLAVLFITALIALILLFRGEFAIIREPLDAISAFLGSRFCRFLGDTSYGVYLVHLPILWTLAAWLVHQTFFNQLATPARFSIVLSAIVLSSYPIAFLMHKYVEQPGIIIGRRLVRRIRPEQPSPVVI